MPYTLNGGESGEWILAAVNCREVYLGTYQPQASAELPAFTVEEINEAIETLQEQSR